MKFLYKRKSVYLFITTLLCFLFLIGCTSVAKGEDVKSDVAVFSVNFIDLNGEDCTFIHFPDGKNVLIDCGQNKQFNKDAISSFLTQNAVHTIDLFILSSPLEDSLGSAKFVLENFSVKKVLIPYVAEIENYPLFYSFTQALNEKQVETSYTEALKGIEGENYSLTILAPKSLHMKDSPYQVLVDNPSPTSREIKNVSPSIYVEYKGIRFLLLGSADEVEEEKLIDSYSRGFYSSKNVNLSEIDFLKCADHGSSQSNSEALLSLLKPKTAVFSVGQSVGSAYPQTATLTRLLSITNECNVVRTDIFGTYVAKVTGSGKIYTFDQIQN